VEEEQYTKEHNEEYCASCGKVIKKEAFVCPHCGIRNTKSNQGNEINKFIAGLLAIFLGGLGIHKFYLRKPIEGVFYILWLLVFSALYIAGILFYEKIDSSSSIWYFLPHVSEMVALIILICISNIPKLIAFIEGIVLLCMSEDAFNEMYNNTYDV